MSSTLRLIVGLGNPTPSYSRTRHNVGRDFIDALAAEGELDFSKNRQAEIVRLPIIFDLHTNEEIVGAKLLCFMNESGGPVKQLMERKYLKPDQLLIVLDDFMLPFGTLRLRTAGSSGGHNGLQSIIEVLGTDQFPRLRVGVGPVPPERDPANFVLERFSTAECERLPKIYEAIKTGLGLIAQNGISAAMNAINRNHLT